MERAIVSRSFILVHTSKPLMAAIDGLNKKFKSDKIKLGNQDLKRTWKMRQERLSAKFTTNIKEIITVK